MQKKRWVKKTIGVGGENQCKVEEQTTTFDVIQVLGQRLPPNELSMEKIFTILSRKLTL